MNKSFLVHNSNGTDKGDLEPRDIVDGVGLADVWRKEKRSVQVGDQIQTPDTTMWECFLIKRLDDGSIGYYFK